MEYVNLGNTGVRVSELCFGTMSFGAEADEEESGKLYRRCREAGINFFDCANTYAKGRSEEILGRLMAGERDALVIATKFANPTGGDDPNARGASRRHLTRAVEDSLRRLNTDRIDLYYIHHPDPHTPMEETLRGLEDLVRAGKILHPAISNHPAWEIAMGLGIAAREGLTPFACVQPMYSLLKRQAEVELLPLAKHAGMAVCPYSPIAAGLLSGKYAGGKPGQGRLLENAKYQQRYGGDWVPHAVAEFLAHARTHGEHPVSLAVAWVAAHPAVTAPIIGARNVAQLEDSLRSLTIRLSPRERDELSALTPHPGSATDRTEEL